MLRRGLAAGTLLTAVLTGCAALVPAIPLAARPGERLAIINLKTVVATVDKSLQETVAISFVPPQAMAIESIEYRFDGRPVSHDEFDLILETARLRVGNHDIGLHVKADGSVVQGTTVLTIVESGKAPAPAEDEAGSSTGGRDSKDGVRAPGPQGTYTARDKAQNPAIGADQAEAKAKVSITIRYPDD